MRTILLLNGGKAFYESGGKLSETLQEIAKETLESLGFNVLETHIDKGYNEAQEIQKILSSDVLIWQFPGWWMGEPWIVKEYIDKVFMAGVRTGKFLTGDGRHRDSPSKNYGKGGLLKSKKYLFSTTWNAPLEAFEDKNEFFGGIGIDGVNLHLHKVCEFVGMSALPSFTCYDVVKNPKVEQYIADYKTHLRKVLG
ncbi:flavodoxin family protein [Helicobacter aurati]|uniref:Flavodoxin family protein n=1 Tax=Helicobacter aurati TaxID=137778 RepID=A0A3D8IX25_9HELI|nr:NAD(P)H-dependent oxidoreductase [Helicobacter aurati]RDU69827.1 flavodoxin family protein [Helicobacter aurati]